jgi:hypothetical protein
MIDYEEDGVKYRRKYYNYNYAQGTLVPYNSTLTAGDKVVHRPAMPNKLISTLALLFFSVATVMAQPETRAAAEANYEITLNVLAGSNDQSERGELPPALSSISRQLKSSFGYSNFRMINTYLGRIGSGGNIEYKSLADIFGREQQAQDAPTFLEWRIGNLRPAGPGAADPFLMNQFRFGARVPVRMSGVDPAGKPVQSVNYESLGLNVDRLGIPVNSPALIGTISLPRADGTVFLILTVKPVGNE